MRENQDLTLTCIVANSKPAADIKWYRGHVEYKPGKHLQCVFICVSEYISEMFAKLMKLLVSALIDVLTSTTCFYDENQKVCLKTIFTF